MHVKAWWWGKGVEEEGKEGSKFQESQGVREAAENK